MRNQMTGAGAYGAAQNNTSNQRDREADVIRRVTGGLKRALESGSAIDRARAIADTRMLWSVFLTDLNSAENGLPTPLRAQLYSIGLAVMRECESDPDKADIPFIVDIHQSLIDGLSARMEQPQAPAAMAAVSGALSA